MWRKTAVGALFLLIAGVALAHYDVVPPLIGFGMYLLAGLIGLACVIGGVVGWTRRESGAPLVTIVGFVPAIAVGIPVALGITAGAPRINDISTDLSEPPPLQNGSAYPQSFVPVVREHYSDLQPLRLSAPPHTVLATAKFVAQSREGWTINEGENGLLYGVAATGLFRFRDDFTIRVRRVKRDTVVDMRSRSRDGKGDFGVNAARIRDFLADLKRSVAP